MADYTLGIDMGTSGVKVAVLDLSRFRLVALAMQSYDNAALQPSTMLWEATTATIRKAVAGIDAKAIRGVGLSSQMHGTVLYDARGEVIEPIINWQDKRGDVRLPKYGHRSTVEAMMALLAGPEFEDLGIATLPSGYLGATLFHIKENDPALFDHIRHVALPGDFIRGKLLGACDFATDPTNACGTGLFNTRLNQWHESVIAKLGLPSALLPRVHSTTAIAGALPDAIARSLGLQPGVPVTYGGGDNQMSLLGNGLLSGDSPVLINIGTGAQISKVTPRYARAVGVDTRSYFNGAYVFVGASMGGGRNYAQLRDALRAHEGQDFGYRQMDALAAQTAVGADGLVYQVRSRFDQQRQEGFSGRTDLRDPGCQARAVMEGVLLDLVALRPPTLGSKAGFMIGAGKGLLDSRVWAQMAADFFACPLKITNFENAVWGAALTAAVGVGAVQEVNQAVAAIEYSLEMAPNPVHSAQYQDLIAQRLGASALM
ncbi:xylulokinase [Candidatus Amarolinea aalborgensis]|uniref:xylulokinase n=1 Tax=Candidatus Amarolinea aalborgensis TaxID=2249329 RepID=UPI003BF9E93B